MNCLLQLDDLELGPAVLLMLLLGAVRFYSSFAGAVVYQFVLTISHSCHAALTDAMSKEIIHTGPGTFGR